MGTAVRRTIGLGTGPRMTRRNRYKIEVDILAALACIGVQVIFSGLTGVFIVDWVWWITALPLGTAAYAGVAIARAAQ